MPELAEFFEHFPMRTVGTGSLDAVLAEPGAAPLRILFLWGHDCVNCDLAKREILLAPARHRWPDVEWLHANVYEDRELGLRFGLHGIPAFIVFRDGRRIGRISPWPGSAPFRAAIEAQRAGRDQR